MNTNTHKLLSIMNLEENIYLCMHSFGQFLADRQILKKIWPGSTEEQTYLATRKRFFLVKAPIISCLLIRIHIDFHFLKISCRLNHAQASQNT